MRSFARLLSLPLAIGALGLHSGLVCGTAHAAGFVTITGVAQGATPFIGTISAAIGGAKLGSVTSTVVPQSGSHTRPFAVSFAAGWLARTGKLSGGQVNIPAFSSTQGRRTLSRYYSNSPMDQG